jgi:hypothetical protein
MTTTRSLSHLHPDYVTFSPYWQQVADTLAGERVVKAKGVTYLPMTDGMLKLKTTDRNTIYEAYKAKAVFLNFVEETGESILGMMDRKPAHIVLPTKLDPYHSQMTTDGLGIAELLKFVNRHQIYKGRVGLLPDISEGGKLPFVSVYAAESILNWASEYINGKEVLSFVALDQSGPQMINGEWEDVEEYLVLLVRDGEYCQYTCNDIGHITSNPPDGTELTFPSIAGKTLGFIPFVFASARDNTTDVLKPPLMEISNISLAAYRQDADYRSALYFAGQPTLTAVGVRRDEVENAVIGSQSMLFSENKDAKFGYAETSGNSLSASKQALDDLKAEANKRGVALMDQGVESGAALEQRSASKTANINTIVTAGKQAMVKLLGYICEWAGIDGSEIVVEPNMDFLQDNLTAADLVSLMTAKNLGAPISVESVHAWMKDRKYTDMDFETEKEKIAEELLDFAPRPATFTATETGQQ